MVQFAVSTPALGYSAASITGAIAQFDAHVAQVTASVNAVAGASWTGSAADAFLLEWTSFLNSAAVTREALMSIAVRLQTAQGTYEGNEGQLVASTKSSNVSIRMPGGGGSSGAAAPADAQTTAQVAASLDSTPEVAHGNLASQEFRLDQPVNNMMGYGRVRSPESQGQVFEALGGESA